ncbi:arginase family protein [Paraburkholderia sp.]|uniref:arginase family protein n=1 Tax=Paraburkholderia sp. TaxID=1926495 RepID=UPI003D6FDBAE
MDTASRALTIFAGRTADRNARGMAGAAKVGAALARRLGLEPVRIGEPEAPFDGDWRAQLAAALPSLKLLSARYDRLLRAEPGAPLLTVMGRCASALATLPVVARYRPDAAIVWFDAHGDCNTPATTKSGYLGGLVLTGASGRWSANAPGVDATGLGADLDLANVILVGARDLDPSERALIDAGALTLVPAGDRLAERLRTAIAGREVYVHLDCDVLNPGIVPTEYAVDGGLSLDELSAAAQVLADSGAIGLEIAEFEDGWSGAQAALKGADAPCAPDALLDALAPLMGALQRL